MRHRYNPLELDMQGDWDGLVRYHRGEGRFVRYLDRNGEHWEPVAHGAR
ncbi:hypothetical protein [Mycolicibacterium sphagni]|nr:hypothetical protein [Mycolicibacterium sphagni]MCV7174791.1 hypothetical protein [Mycolicibacterium sphagni]